MIRVAIVGDIGSGKSHIAKLFNYPIFNADLEVAKIYNTNRQVFRILKNNNKKKAVILDIPLLLENKLNQKEDIIIFIQSKKIEVLKRLKKRNNFNISLLNKFKKIQLPLDYKKKKSQFIIKNNFTKKSVKRAIHNILKEIL